MPVQINITGADAAESLKELAALASGFATTPEAPKPTRTRTKPAEAPKQDPEPEPETEAADEEPAVAVTPEELRAKAQAVAKSGKQPEVKELLAKFGVKSISEVADNDRAAFMAALGDL